jgi:hypothetical protein
MTPSSTLRYFAALGLHVCLAVVALVKNPVYSQIRDRHELFSRPANRATGAENTVPLSLV